MRSLGPRCRGGDSQSGGASGDHDIAQQPNQPPLTNDELEGLDRQELPNLGQEGTPPRDIYPRDIYPRDIYQENLEQILAKYKEEEAETRPTRVSRDTSGRVNTRDMANTRTRSKPRLNYTILHRMGRKELAVKAIYLTPAFAHAFVNALSKHQWTRTIKGLPPEPRNWTQFNATQTLNPSRKSYIGWQILGGYAIRRLRPMLAAFKGWI